MTEETHTIVCHQHGEQEETFVCQHVVLGLAEGEPYGFWWSSGSKANRPDAWCTACNEMLAESGGEWTEENEAFAGVKILCGKCYDTAKMQNGF